MFAKDRVIRNQNTHLCALMSEKARLTKANKGLEKKNGAQKKKNGALNKTAAAQAAMICTLEEKLAKQAETTSALEEELIGQAETIRALMDHEVSFDKVLKINRSLKDALDEKSSNLEKMETLLEGTLVREVRDIIRGTSECTNRQFTLLQNVMKKNKGCIYGNTRVILLPNEIHSGLLVDTTTGVQTIESRDEVGPVVTKPYGLWFFQESFPESS